MRAWDHQPCDLHLATLQLPERSQEPLHRHSDLPESIKSITFLQRPSLTIGLQALLEYKQNSPINAIPKKHLIPLGFVLQHHNMLLFYKALLQEADTVGKALDWSQETWVLLPALSVACCVIGASHFTFVLSCLFSLYAFLGRDCLAMCLEHQAAQKALLPTL